MEKELKISISKALQKDIIDYFYRYEIYPYDDVIYFVKHINEVINSEWYTNSKLIGRNKCYISYIKIDKIFRQGIVIPTLYCRINFKDYKNITLLITYSEYSFNLEFQNE